MAAIGGIVRWQLIYFLEETKMSKYKFSKISELPPSTLRSILNKEDYDVGESNIYKICQGMGIKPYELFLKESDKECISDDKEIEFIQSYRRLTHESKLKLEGYLYALKQDER